MFLTILYIAGNHCFGADGGTLADHHAGTHGGHIAGFGNVQTAFGHGADRGAFLNADILGHDAVLDGGARLDDGAAHDHGCFHSSPLLYDDAREEDGVVDGAVDTAAFRHHGVDDGGVVADALAGLAGVAGIDFPVFIKQVDAGMAGVQDLHVGLPQAGNGAHVLPVTAEVVGVHTAPVLEQVGNDVFAEVVFGVGVGLVLGEVLFQDIPVEDVDAHGRQVGLGVLGFFLELADLVVLVGDHQAKAGSLAPRHFHNSNGEFRILLLVEAQEVGIILLADLVTGQDDNILGVIPVNEGQVLVDGVGRALVPVRTGGLLIRGQHMNTAVQTVQVPGLAVADILVEDQRLILSQDTNGVNIGIDTVGQRKVNDTVLSAEGYRRLGELLGQRVQARALAAGQDHCDHFFCHKISPLKILAYAII